MSHKNKSLKDLLLIHELAFIVLIVLAAAAGAVGIHLWEKSSQESSRISLLVQEVQQTRGDLYRQMKELFDAYFLEDTEARQQYDAFTQSVEAHFIQLNTIAEGKEEHTAIQDLHASYQQFVYETSALFDQSRGNNNAATQDAIRQTLDIGLETGLFKRYEEILARTEKLLSEKQSELDVQLKSTKRISVILLIIPLTLAILLLIFSRMFLKRAIVKPIQGVLQATSEISAGNLTHRAPEEGVHELASVSKAINEMADQLIVSQETLVRTEKQAAQGLLVPMLAHNIRNPLASIRATAQVIDTPEHDTETQESLIGIINTVDRLERWTGALLAYLHPLKPQPSYTTVAEVLEGALAPLQQKIKEKSIKLILPQSTHLKLFTDQHLLEQVIYNLLLNAIDASSKHSAIEITLEIQDQEIILSLKDEGCGMPFTPDPSTVSLSPTTKRFGTGLGIPFAFKVCDALGGHLNFRSRETGGTIIAITLPHTLTINT
ncbi:MAG: sensor histidine kinase [Methylotenera sp.]|nr:MAG: sensor histidine kinase [Methylotenera sp.]